MAVRLYIELDSAIVPSTVNGIVFYVDVNPYREGGSGGDMTGDEIIAVLEAQPDGQKLSYNALDDLPTIPAAVPDVTVNQVAFSPNINLSQPNQYSATQLSEATEFSPVTALGITDSGNFHIVALDLNNITPTFTGFVNNDVNSEPDLTAGLINIIYFWKAGVTYYYMYGTPYTGVIDDTTAPTLSAVSISAITQIAAQINATSNEAATLYWGVYANGATAPTYAQLALGTGAIDYGSVVLSAGVSGNDVLSSLVNSTPYDVYYAAVDASANHTDPVLIEFSTIARTQLTTPNPSGTQLDADTARFTWANITGNVGYSYRSRVDSGSWSSYTSLPTNTTQVDIDGTTGQVIGFQILAIGNTTTNVDSDLSTEDSVTLTANSAPVASNVVILHPDGEGLGDTLTGDYDYSDNESNPESGSTFRWLRNGSTSVGTSLTYVIALADQGATLTFEVTPVSSAGTSPGSPAQSSALSIPANAAPTFASVTLSGTAQEGQTLTATPNTYNDVDDDLAGTHTYQWEVSDNGTTGWADISGATANTYTILTAQVGKYLRCGVTPVATTGTTPGTEVFSAASGQVTGSEPIDLTINTLQNIDKVGTVYTSTASSAYCVADDVLAGDFTVIMDITDISGVQDSGIMGVKSTPNNVAYNSSPHGYEYFVWQTNGLYYRGYNLGNVLSTGVAAQVGDKLRLRRTSGIFYAEYYRGSTWTLLYQYATESTVNKYAAFTIGTTGDSFRNPKKL